MAADNRSQRKKERDNVNDKILAVLTATPQSANAIATALNARPPAIRRALKALREDGTIEFSKVRGIFQYTRVESSGELLRKAGPEARAAAVDAAINTGHKRTREKLHALQIERANTHRARERAATSSQDKRMHRERAERREKRALAFA